MKEYNGSVSVAVPHRRRILTIGLILLISLVLFFQLPAQTPVQAQATGPVITLSASCTVDAQGTFVITNTGTNMLSAGSYTLLLNGASIATGSFTLAAGQSTTIRTAGLFGTLELNTSGGGTTPAKVSTFCQSPTNTPTATLVPPPVISLSASCTPDAQGTFVITNIGRNMPSAGTFTLLLNGTPIANGSFQLVSGGTTSVRTAGLFGTLELDTSGGGAAPATVSTFCQSPTATPTPLPPVISLSASCTPDAQGTFVITNTGANMPSAGTYTLLLNGISIANGSFQLAAGGTTTVRTAGLFGTLELDTSGGGAAPASVSTFCQSPTATPTVTPTLAPTIQLSATCTASAQGTFTITNIGSSMPSAGSYTLLLNGTPIANGNFQLASGASTQVHTAGLFGTLELDTSGGGTAPATVSTFCQSPTGTATNTPTSTATSNITSTSTATPTVTTIASNTPTATPTVTTIASNTPTSTPTVTTIASNTPTATPTVTTIASNTPTATPTVTTSPSDTPTPTVTTSPSDTPTPTVTTSPSDTPTPTITTSPSDTPTPTITTSPSDTPTLTETVITSASSTPTPTETTAPTATKTPKYHPSRTPTVTNTPRPSFTPRPSHTPRPSFTPRPSHTPRPSFTPRPSHTPRPSFTPRPSHTPRPSFTPRLSRTPRPSFTPRPSHTPRSNFTPWWASRTPRAGVTAQPSLTSAASLTPAASKTAKAHPTQGASYTPRPSHTPGRHDAPPPGSGGPTAPHPGSFLGTILTLLGTLISATWFSIIRRQ